MARSLRTDIGGQIYHVLNRANAKVKIFDNENDYRLFEKLLEGATTKYEVKIYAYCVMPNHWHILLKTKKDGELSKFMSWLTNTHTKKWHSLRETTGEGHLYQGRYKSFICQDNDYFLTLVRYIERNPKKANLVPNSEDWKWSSVWRRTKGDRQKKNLLSPWILKEPENYLFFLNEPQTEQELAKIEHAIKKGSPYGNDHWTIRIAKKFNLQSKLRNVGRPKKDGL